MGTGLSNPNQVAKMEVPFAEKLDHILRSDARRWFALQAVASLNLPDSWIGAGFVRDAVWDHLHGYPPRTPLNDVDVVWFDRRHASKQSDEKYAVYLSKIAPEFDWSVNNQALMHEGNGDPPYRDVNHAMLHWPETATAVAVRLINDCEIEIAAPFGMADLFSGLITPTDTFTTTKRRIFELRLTDKRWLERYPLLKVNLAPKSS